MLAQLQPCCTCLGDDAVVCVTSIAADSQKFRAGSVQFTFSISLSGILGLILPDKIKFK